MQIRAYGIFVLAVAYMRRSRSPTRVLRVRQVQLMYF